MFFSRIHLIVVSILIWSFSKRCMETTVKQGSLCSCLESQEVRDLLSKGNMRRQSGLPYRLHKSCMFWFYIIYEIVANWITLATSLVCCFLYLVLTTKQQLHVFLIVSWNHSIEWQQVHYVNCNVLPLGLL